MTNLLTLSKLIEHGQFRESRALVELLLQNGLSPELIMREAIMPGLQEVGRKFETGEIFLPDMLLAARAAKFSTEAIRAQVGCQPSIFKQRIVLGTVQGDLHDIGKNLVAITMQSNGIGVMDLGVDVPPQQFVHAVESDKDIMLVGISALLSTTLPVMKETVRALRQSTAADRITILVGGAPVTEKYAKAIGADIYTETAFSAAEAARKILEERGDLS